MDISENELEIWYEPQDRFAVSSARPARDWIGPVEPREFIENRQLPDEAAFSASTTSSTTRPTAQLHLDLPQPVFRNPDGGRRPGRARGRCGCMAARCATGATTAGSSATTRGRSAESASARPGASPPSSRSARMSTIPRSARWPAASASSRSPTSTKRRAAYQHHQQPGADARRPLQARRRRAGHGHRRRQWLRRARRPVGRDDRHEHGESLVAGVAGLMLAVEPKLTAAQIEGSSSAPRARCPAPTSLAQRRRLRPDRPGRVPRRSGAASTSGRTSTE